MKHLLTFLLIITGTAGVYARGLDFLPEEARAAVDTVERAREAWEQRRSEVVAQLSIQPWEEEEEFARRVERAIERGAGREHRYLEFQLNELRRHSFVVESDHVELVPEAHPDRGNPWFLNVRTDLGFLPEPDVFTVAVQPKVRDDTPREHGDLARAIEQGSLGGRIVFSISGYRDGTYRMRLDRISLLDTSHAGPAFAEVSMNRFYLFGRDMAITTPRFGGRVTFEDRRVPDEFSYFGDAEWTVTSAQSFSGDHSLRAGGIGHYEISGLRYTVTVPGGAETARVRFAVRTSTESYYDDLTFIVDGSPLDTWSGFLDWKEVSFDISLDGRGVMELVWQYAKDGSVSEGDDTVWIDDIRVDFE